MQVHHGIICAHGGPQRSLPSHVVSHGRASVLHLVLGDPLEGPRAWHWPVWEAGRSVALDGLPKLAVTLSLAIISHAKRPQ
eukprot:6265753-Pyramimonas_sp.AAC.1